MNPRRLVAGLSFLAASSLVLGGCGGTASQVSTAPIITETFSSGPGVSSLPAPSLVEPSYPTSAAPVAAPPAFAAQRAVQFVTILGHTKGVDRDTWTNQLTALCSQSFGDHLALDSPSEIPGQKVTGAPSLIGNNPLLIAAYFVPTTKDGFTVYVDYTTAPGVITGALPGHHSLEEGPS